MDFDILDSLEDLGYSLKSDCKIIESLEIGPKSPEFTQLVEWLSKQLQALCDLDSCVNSITDPADSSSFLLEVSSFLKELHCPYKDLISGPISQRLIDRKSRLVLLDFLSTELQAARLILHKEQKRNALEIEMDDSDIATSLTAVQNVLNIKRRENDDPKVLFSEIQEKINPDCVLKAAIEESLSDVQWESLDSLHKDFLEEYRVRRELLLTRLDVTIQSFKWGEFSKGKESKILDAYLPKRKQLNIFPSVKISDLLAARESILIIEKTSSVELVRNTKSSLNRILISAVPDRGGRPREQRPALEMPNWMKRSGGGRGNRQQGNQSSKKPKGGHKGGRSFDAAGSY